MLNIFTSHDALRRAIATQVAACAAEAVARRGRFTVAFSGGSLPALVCPPLVTVLAAQIDWSAWHLFFADERWAPRDHPESNYRLLREQLLDHVPIPPDQIYAMDEELPPAAAATAYAAKLAAIFGAAQPPSFDLLLLGMGPDGHIASLFPDHALLAEGERWVAAIADAPKPPPYRITFTLPLLNRARQVSFVVTGRAKAAVVAQIFTKPPTTALPASLVRPPNGSLDWFLDQDAATELPTGLRHTGIAAERDK